MRTKLASVIILIVLTCSWTNTSQPEFLFLKPDQLKLLGIFVTEQGLFYKNFNPNWQQDSEKYSCLSFYCSNTNYLTTNHYLLTDQLTVKGRNGRILSKMKTTKNDFYPLLIGDNHGEQSLDNETLPVGLKMLPVAICMSDTKLPNRFDTIVIWLKPTMNLRKVLPAYINMDEYLRTRLNSHL